MMERPANPRREEKIPAPKRVAENGINIEEANELLQQAAYEVSDYLSSLSFTDIPIEPIMHSLAVTYERNPLASVYGPNDQNGSAYIKVPGNPGALTHHIHRHELTHAFARKKYLKSKNQARTGVDVSRLDGFHYTTRKQILFRALNEGITDEIARRAAQRRPESLLQTIINVCSKLRYFNERKLVNTICKTMAEAEESTPDDIFHDLIDVYLHGWNRDFKTRLRNTYGKDILKVLATLSSGSDRFFTSDDNGAIGNKDIKSALDTYLDIHAHHTERDTAAKHILRTLEW